MRRTTWRALSFVSLVLVMLGGCAPHLAVPDDAGAGDAAIARPDLRDAASHAPVPRDAAVAAPLRSTTAPPVSPSMISLHDGARVALTDPDTDRLYVVTLDGGEILAIDLPRGTEPGRLVEDGAGRVHVVLRRGAGIATLEPGASIVTRRETCAAPRGIGWRASDDTLVVACAEGRVVVLPAVGGLPLRVFRVDDDLRDVVVLGDRTLISRFRSAEVIALDVEGAVVARYQPAAAERADVLARAADPTSTATATFEPEVAWRMIAVDGGAWLLHQRARTTPIRATALGISYGAPAVDPRTDCGFALVESAVSMIAGDQPSGTLSPSRPLVTVLATDITARPLPPSLRADGPLDAPSVDDGACATFPTDTLTTAGGTVTYSPTHGVVRAGGHPLALSWSTGGAPSHLVLAEEPTWTDADLGRSIFETVQPSRIACASCHPEGGEDGHVWAQGSGIALRTQTMQGGILGTAPFHWEGDMPDLGSLVDEVLVGRMRGSPLHPARARAFAEWIDALEPPSRPGLDGDMTTRGRRLFESAELGCTSCHDGPSYSSGETVDVGTGGLFQVPALVGVGYRAPFMHSGCATTLRERFTGSPACTGGDAHGHTSELTQTEIDDLVAYLQSL